MKQNSFRYLCICITYLVQLLGPSPLLVPPGLGDQCSMSETLPLQEPPGPGWSVQYEWDLTSPGASRSGVISTVWMRPYLSRSLQVRGDQYSMNETLPLQEPPGPGWSVQYEWDLTSSGASRSGVISTVWMIPYLFRSLQVRGDQYSMNETLPLQEPPDPGRSVQYEWGLTSSGASRAGVVSTVWMRPYLFRSLRVRGDQYCMNETLPLQEPPGPGWSVQYEWDFTSSGASRAGVISTVWMRPYLFRSLQVRGDQYSMNETLPLQEPPGPGWSVQYEWDLTSSGASRSGVISTVWVRPYLFRSLQVRGDQYSMNETLPLQEPPGPGWSVQYEWDLTSPGASRSGVISTVWMRPYLSLCLQVWGDQYSMNETLPLQEAPGPGWSAQYEWDLTSSGASRSGVISTVWVRPYLFRSLQVRGDQYSMNETLPLQEPPGPGWSVQYEWDLTSPGASRSGVISTVWVRPYLSLCLQVWGDQYCMNEALPLQEPPGPGWSVQYEWDLTSSGASRSRVISTVWMIPYLFRSLQVRGDQYSMNETLPLQEPPDPGRSVQYEWGLTSSGASRAGVVSTVWMRPYLFRSLRVRGDQYCMNETLPLQEPPGPGWSVQYEWDFTSSGASRAGVISTVWMRPYLFRSLQVRGDQYSMNETLPLQEPPGPGWSVQYEWDLTSPGASRSGVISTVWVRPYLSFCLQVWGDQYSMNETLPLQEPPGPGWSVQYEWDLTSSGASRAGVISTVWVRPYLFRSLQVRGDQYSMNETLPLQEPPGLGWSVQYEWDLTSPGASRSGVISTVWVRPYLSLCLQVWGDQYCMNEALPLQEPPGPGWSVQYEWDLTSPCASRAGVVSTVWMRPYLFRSLQVRGDPYSMNETLPLQEPPGPGWSVQYEWDLTSLGASRSGAISSVYTAPFRDSTSAIVFTGSSLIFAIFTNQLKYSINQVEIIIRLFGIQISVYTENSGIETDFVSHLAKPLS